MFRFTIRDVLWLVTVAGLATTVALQRHEVARARRSTVLSERRIELVKWLLNQNGYKVSWGDDNLKLAPIATYPSLIRAGAPVDNNEIPWLKQE